MEKALGFKTGDKVRHVSGCHVYTIQEIEQDEAGRYKVKFEKEPEAMRIDLADLVHVKE